LNISASVGIAGVPSHAATSDEVLRRADSAMYLAKKRTRRDTWFTRRRAINDPASARVSRRHSPAIDGRQFVVDYQPIVQPGNQQGSAVESLVRWDHPELGRLPPDDFIRIAEHTGLVDPLTSFVLETALTDWPRSARPDGCGIAVNVSPRSLHDAAFERVRTMLERHRVPATALASKSPRAWWIADPEGSDPLSRRSARHGRAPWRSTILAKATRPSVTLGATRAPDQDRSLSSSSASPTTGTTRWSSA
jgi:hypothetical protein